MELVMRLWIMGLTKKSRLRSAEEMVPKVQEAIVTAAWRR